MARITAIEFGKQNGFNMVSRVRENTSGYLYATFLIKESPDNAENVYFGKRFAQEGGYKVGDVLNMPELFVTEVENAAGETRWKLTDKEGDAEATLIAKGYQGF